MKVGDLITIKFLSAYKKTQISFVKVTKIGHKYVYGITLWNTENDGLREGHPCKYEISRLVIYPGIRKDLSDLLDNYDINVRQWYRDKELREREVDGELKDLKYEMMDEWKKDYPMPKFPELPEPN